MCVRVREREEEREIGYCAKSCYPPETPMSLQDCDVTKNTFDIPVGLRGEFFKNRLIGIRGGGHLVRKECRPWGKYPMQTTPVRPEPCRPQGTGADDGNRPEKLPGEGRWPWTSVSCH